MDEKEQRIAIAKACGWTKTRHRESNGLDYPNAWENPKDKSAKMPDYLNDLNAMNEAEKMLDAGIIDTRSLFIDYLTLVCGWGTTKKHSEAVFEAHYLSVRSTAAQRAEAFLKTLGLWEEAA